MAWYRHTAIVKCSLGFPIDMLRYDSCYPVTESGAGVIEDSFGCGIRTHQEIEIETVQRGKQEPWTVERWKSFGCRIQHKATIRT